MSSALFLQVIRTTTSLFKRVSDGLILELDVANNSSYTGANGSVTDGSTFTNLSTGANSNFQLENNTGNLVAYIDSTPKYISAKPYDKGYLVSGNTDANKISGYDVEYIVQSVRDMNAAVSMNNTTYQTQSRTIEWWGRVTKPPGHSSYIAPGAVGTFTYFDSGTGNTKSFLYGGLYRSAGTLQLIDNANNTCNLKWEWDDVTTANSATIPLTLNTWTQVVTVLEPASVGAADIDFFRCTYYVNGQYAGTTQSDDVNGITGTQIWYIGRTGRAYANNGTTSNTYFSGLTHCDTSIFRQYNRALTAAEILQNYNAEKTKFGFFGNSTPPSPPPSNVSATYIITADGASNTRRDYNAALASTGFNGSAWVTQSGVTRAPQPGDIIEFAAGTHGRTRFLNFDGTSVNKYTFRGPSTGQAIFRKATPANNFVLEFTTCYHFTLDGESGTQSPGADGKRRNIKLMYPATWTTYESTTYLKFSGVSGSSSITKLSTSHNCTVRYVEIDGGWSNEDNRQESLSIGMQPHDTNVNAVDNPGLFQENMIFEHNLVNAVSAECLYVGPNYYVNLSDTSQSQRRPPLRNITVRYNYITNCGKEGINTKNWWQGTNAIHDNILINNAIALKPEGSTDDSYATASILATACAASIYNNYVYNSGGSGIASSNDGGSGVSPGDLQPGNYYVTELLSRVYNNIVINTKKNATTIQDRGITSAFSSGRTPINCQVFNNTVSNAVGRGISIYQGWIRNNIIIGSGSAATNINTSGDATNNYIQSAGNWFVIQDYVNPENGNWRLINPQTAVGTIGVDISATDIAGVTRDATPQVGAYESSTIVTGSYNPPFPRLGGRMRLTTDLTESQFNEDVAKIAKMHVWVESTWRDHSFVNGTYNQSNIVSHIRSVDTPYPGNNSIMGVYTNPVQGGTDVNQYTNKLFAESGVGGNRDWFLRYAGAVVGQAGDDPATYTTTVSNQIQAGKSVGGSVDANVSSKFRPNPNLATTPDSSTVAPFTSGMRWHQWYARWWAHPSSEHTANLGDWTATGHGIMEPGSGWDFVYSDEVNLGDSFSNPTNADWDDDGVNEARTDADIATLIKNYHVAYREAWQTLFGYYGRPNTMFFANLASLSQPAQPWHLNSNFIDVYNGGIVERVSGYEHGDSSSPYGAPIVGQGSGFGDWSASVTNGDTGTGFMGRYWRSMRYTKNPKLVLFENDTTQVKAQWDAAGGIHAGKSLYYWARYYLCACLLDDGYYYASNGGSDSASGTPEAEFGRIPWLDEYHGGSLNQKGWMGYPKLSTPPRTAYSNGVWVREFDNALVIINPYGNGTRTITLPSPGTGFKWKRLSGSQDSTTNNGADQSLSLTIAEHDGFILRRVAL